MLIAEGVGFEPTRPVKDSRFRGGRITTLPTLPGLLPFNYIIFIFFQL